MGCTAQHPGPPGLCLQRPTPISIFEDRIEFVTIGGLAKGIGLCKEIGWVVRKDVGAALGVSQAAAILLLREMTDMPPAAGRTSQGTGTESLWERLPEIKPGEESGS